MSKSKKTAKKTTPQPKPRSKSNIRPAVSPDASDAMPDFGAPGEVIGEPEATAPAEVPVEAPAPETPAPEAPVAAEPPAPAPAPKKRKSRAKNPLASLTCLGAVCNDYLASLAGKGKSAGTARSYAADVAVLLKHFGRETEISTITEAAVAEFFDCDLVRKKRNGVLKERVSIAKICRIARQVFEYAVEVRVIDAAPLPQKAEAAA